MLCRSLGQLSANVLKGQDERLVTLIEQWPSNAARAHALPKVQRAHNEGGNPNIDGKPANSADVVPSVRRAPTQALFQSVLRRIGSVIALGDFLLCL
jgi:hypothetical protein